jgi:hypothetical protein
MAKAKKSEAAADEAKKPTPASKPKVAEPAKPAAQAKAAAPPKADASKATATKKPAARKGKKEDKSPARPTGTPMVDTSLAAESAARMLMGRAKLGAAQPAAAAEASGSEKESASFKQFKDSVNKPASQGPGKAFGNTFAPKNPLPIPGANPVFHNQTQGGGASRINVPRRTGG